MITLELFSRVEVLLLFLPISWRVQRVNLVILHIVVVTVLHQLLLLLWLPPGLRQVFDLLWADSGALLGERLQLLIVLLWQLLQLLLLLSCISLNNWIRSLHQQRFCSSSVLRGEKCL